MLEKIKSKIHSWESIPAQLQKWRAENQNIVFTNGCFDLLHYGHLHYLLEARNLGDRLIIGLNSSASVKRLKGNHRPINDDQTRNFMLAALECVDAVIEFEEDTPFQLIQLIVPNLLVKGGDYQTGNIVGADLVIENGGKVLTLPFIKGYSTSAIEQKIKNS